MRVKGPADAPTRSRDNSELESANQNRPSFGWTLGCLDEALTVAMIISVCGSEKGGFSGCITLPFLTHKIVRTAKNGIESLL